MLDEFLFLDLPQTCKTPSGLVLEYGKAVQESVYEHCRVVHEGILRISFGHDLKVLDFGLENFILTFFLYIYILTWVSSV